MILPIYIYGMPVLRKVAEDITPDYPELKTLIKDMWQTLESSGGIGLAAPQIGKAIRIVLIDLTPLKEDMPQYENFKQVYINAHILEYDETTKETSDEGCLSVPGLSEKVTRPTRIRVKWMDEQFDEHEEWVDGYLARVMQHEFDHLEGALYVDRVSPLRKTLLKNKLKAMAQGKYSASYKTKGCRK
ncbi:MAG: peptide deformylase [Bacteroidaceae bacterium]|nr:peptide deformylase [Bacteroidaceae bacterium]